MPDTFGSRLQNAWNVFRGRGEETSPIAHYGPSFGQRPDRIRLSTYSERTIINPIYTQIAIDAASIDLKHVRVDKEGRYLKDVRSGLNECLTLEANLDQPATHFRQDMVTTLLDKGVMAVVPVETTVNPNRSGGYDILSMRVGEVIDWFPRHVVVRLYDDRTGRKEDLTLPKNTVAIVENPLYNVMNEPNSTLQRLLRKLNLLDITDERNASGKLDIILQLPYVIKSESRQNQAEKRRKDIEEQLVGSKYGIAYVDGTEQITQLNRPAENNLRDQVADLTKDLYKQLGLTPEVFDGTASEEVMINYHNRTLAPILTAIQESMKRTFLTKTARTQGQSIEFFRDPFKLVPVAGIADMADKFTRNEIMSSNEFRQVVGLRPSDDPKADELRNKNMPQVDGESDNSEPTESNQNET